MRLLKMGQTLKAGASPEPSILVDDEDGGERRWIGMSSGERVKVTLNGTSTEVWCEVREDGTAHWFTDPSIVRPW